MYQYDLDCKERDEMPDYCVGGLSAIVVSFATFSLSSKDWVLPANYQSTPASDYKHEHTEMRGGFSCCKNQWKSCIFTVLQPSNNVKAWCSLAFRPYCNLICFNESHLTLKPISGPACFRSAIFSYWIQSHEGVFLAVGSQLTAEGYCNAIYPIEMSFSECGYPWYHTQ